MRGRKAATKMPTELEITKGKLALLARKLKGIELSGHEYVSDDLPADWLDRLRRASRKEAAQNAPKAQPAVVAKAKGETLEKIEQEVSGCKKCALAETRTNTVFGVGDPNAKIMFIGEAPGAEEDKRGEPFVGRAGKLLTDMIGAMGFERNDVYIANIIKCRPPGNRDPLPSEVEQCEQYLKRQIANIGPEVICALGRVSAQTLLKSGETISRLRGKFHTYEDTPLLPTFHPAYLLRNPSAKKETWEDLQMILKKLGLEAPQQKGKD